MGYGERVGLNNFFPLFKHVIPICKCLSFKYLIMLSILCNIIIICMTISVFLLHVRNNNHSFNQSINQSTKPLAGVITRQGDCGGNRTPDPWLVLKRGRGTVVGIEPLTPGWCYSEARGPWWDSNP